MKLFCSHVFSIDTLHRFSEEPSIVGALCWKCNRVYTATHGLALPGKLQDKPPAKCPTCDGTGKVST